MKKLLSVIIPTFNRTDLIENSLTALTNQSLDKDLFEVIIVDDGSTDDTESVVRSFADRLNVHYFYQQDKGFRAGKARNIGAAIAEGDYLVMIDSGVLLAPECLQAHLDIHQGHAKPVACVGYVYAFGVADEDVDAVNDLIDVNDVAKSVERLQSIDALDMREPRYTQHGDDLGQWPAPFDVFWTCHVSVNRLSFLKIGMFDESYTTWGGEDVDLGVRLFINNDDWVFGRQCHAVHAPHKSECDDREGQAAICEQAIHDRYQLFETQFYQVGRENDMEINEAIKELGDQYLDLAKSA